MYSQQSTENFGPLKIGRGWFGRPQYAVNTRGYDYELSSNADLDLNKVFDCVDNERENTQVPTAWKFIVDGKGGAYAGSVYNDDPHYDYPTEDALDKWDDLMMRDDDGDAWHGLWHGAVWTHMSADSAFCFAVGAMVKFLIETSKGATPTVIELRGEQNVSRLYRNVVRKDAVIDDRLYLLRMLPVKRNPTFVRRRRLIISA